MAKPKSRRRKVKRLVAEDGTVLTEEEIERMADEAERGLDLSKFVPAVGRPSLGPSGQSPRLSCRVDPRTFEAARRQAEEEGISMSELTRAAIRNYVKV
jgi:hypothetical protein